MQHRQSAGWKTALLVAAAFLAACSNEGGDRNQGPPEVGYRIVHPETVPIVSEFPARVNALKTADVRPQVSGVLQQQSFREGATVREGQPLYQIDPSIYRAAVEQAAANLASAEAQAATAAALADRYKPLAAEQAVSEQDYSNALASARATKAAVQQAKAALDAARINLRFTTVPAPITGHIGRSLTTVGALVTSNQTNALAVISVLDPIYVDIQQSASAMLQLRRQLAAGGVTPVAAEVRLVLDDGSNYPLPGRVEFSEVTVDPTAGTVTMRARFPNPDGVLLPGMFVRARFAQAEAKGAFIVPQVAVSHDPEGNAQLFIVGPDDKAIEKTVTAPNTIGNNWVVTAGLRDGDRVITQGLGKVQPGMAVKAVPDSTPQNIAPPGAERGAGQASGAREKPASGPATGKNRKPEAN